MKQEQTHSSLILHLVIPTILAVLVTLSLSGVFHYKFMEQLYTAQTETTLENNLNLTTSALLEAWENTYGAALRTPERLKNYIQNVLEGRMDVLIFPEGSGVLVLDKHTHSLLEYYPKGRRLSDALIRQVNLYVVGYNEVSQLPSGVFFAVNEVAPLGVRIITYNTKPFERSTLAPFLRFTTLSTFIFGSVLFVVIMLIILTYSVLKPLKKINDKMRFIVEKEDFHHQILAHKGAKEIQELTHQFNTLLSYVEERDHALSMQNDTLEDLVEERTAALKEAQHKLIQSERLAAIGEFASSISHELRNPLSSIKMGIDHIAELPQVTGNNKRRAELIQTEVVRLNKMLKGILSFASPAPTEIQAYDLKKVLTEMMPVLTAFEKEGCAPLTVCALEPLPVYIDVDKFKQALINSVKNAIEASEKENSVTLSIYAKNKHVYVDVYNKTSPIPEALLSRLFDPFFTTKPEGTGLGLSTTKKLIEEMHGTLHILNVEEGVLCRFILPAAEAC